MAKNAKPAVVTAKPLRVTVGGETYTLQPTLAAVQQIDQVCGGLVPAFRDVQAVNVTATAAVILAGSGTRLGVAELKAFTEAVWRDPNRMETSRIVADYLAVLLNGGTPPRADTPEDGEEGEAGATGETTGPA